MNFFMSDQEKGDLLIEVTAWTGLTVYSTIPLLVLVMFKGSGFVLN